MLKLKEMNNSEKDDYKEFLLEKDLPFHIKKGTLVRVYRIGDKFGNTLFLINGDWTICEIKLNYHACQADKKWFSERL